MTDPKKEQKRSDKDFETLSKVEIDGGFTIPVGTEDQTAHLQRPGSESDDRPAVRAGDTHGVRGGDTIPAAGTSRATAIPKAGRSTGSGTPPGTVLGGRFEILNPIGKGGMGEVFLVRDRQIENREVALKLVRSRWSADPRFRDLFFKEIRSAQGFVSEHAVQVRDCGELPDGQLFLTMDFVEGESLTSLLKREKTLMPRHALEIARQVLLGLSSGHERGLIHRDVKPSNVMLAARIPKTGENPHGVKVGLLDFGIAGLTKELEAGRGPGTPHYMSPEQATGEQLDARSDLFAVGVMLFEMISGTRPFDGRTQQEITTSVIETDPIPLVNRLDGLKKPIKRILRKALQKKREKRFSSAADFIAAIESSNSFKQAEGAPSWVAGVAVVMTVATASVSWLYFYQQTQQAKTSVDSKGQANQVTILSGTIGGLRRDLSTRDAEFNSLTKTSNDQAAEIRSLESDLASATAASAASKDSLQGVQIDSLMEQRKKEAVINFQYAHIEDLVEFLDVPLNRYGQNLSKVGVMFDNLMGSIEAGTTEGRSRIVETAIKYGGVGANLPGVSYLNEVEQLANDIDEFIAKTSAGNESFVELADLRRRLDDLSDSSAVSQFETSTSSLEENGAQRGKWLALKALSEDELTDRLIALAERADSAIPVAGEAPATSDLAAEELANDTTGELTEAQSKEAVDNAMEEVGADDLVSQKEALWAWIKQQGKENAAIALYGAQVNPDERANRLAALGRAHTALLERLEAQKAELLSAAVERVQRIGELTDLAARTEELVLFLDQFGVYAEDHAQPLIESLVSDYQLSIVEDGQMQLAGLQGLPRQIDGLVAKVLEDGDLGYEIAADTKTALAWVAGARLWYLGGNRRSSDGTWFAAFAAQELDQPLASYSEPWRKLLAFQYQLKTRCDLMQDRESTRLFAACSANKTPAVQEDWQQLRIERQSGSLVLEEQILELNGRKKRGFNQPDRPIETPGDSTYSLDWKGKSLLRVTDLPPAATFVEWVPTMTAARDLFEQTDARVFNRMNRNTTPAMIAGEPSLLCLEVVVPNGSTYLVHPVLGVVRQDTKAYDYELVHLALER